MLIIQHIIDRLSLCFYFFSGGSEILCSVNSVESFLYSSILAVQSGVTIASIMFFISRDTSTLKSSLSSFSTAFSSLFKSRTQSFLVTGVLLHALSLLSSSFVEEEHQTWYFFTSTFFIIIFCEKSTLFCTRKKRNDSDLPEVNAVQLKSLENKKTQKYMNEKSFDRGTESRNAEFQTDNNAFTDVNLYGLSSTKEENAKTVTSENAHLLRGVAQEMTAKKGVLWSCFVFVLLGLGRLSRAWNQTGIKWADRPDIGDWLVKPENRTMLSISYFASLLFIIVFRYRRQDILTSVVFIIGSAHAYLYRTVTGNLQLQWVPNEPITKGIREARFTYCCVATMVVWNVIRLCKTIRNSGKRRFFQECTGEVCGSLEGLMSGLLLLEVLLQRPHNAVFLAVFVVQERMLSEILWRR